MKKELLETIDETIENICKWANNEFKEKKLTSRDVLLQLEKNEDSKKDTDKKLEIIKCLSELLQSRENMENTIRVIK